MLEIVDTMETLAEERPIFHSEADFQHAFAWEIQRKNPSYSIRLERPFSIGEKKAHVDVWVSSPVSEIAIELKYKTRKLETAFRGESFTLKDQSAQDLGRYDFLLDIQRVETLIKSGDADFGYAIIVSNDSSYWKPPRDHRTIDAAFRIHTGTKVKGLRAWSPSASAGTTKGREAPISLYGIYNMRWKNFAKISKASYGILRFLMVAVDLN